MHRGRSDRAANANANSDAPQKFASEFSPSNLKQKAANYALRRNSLANANGFANEIAHISSSLRKSLANGSLRQNSLAIANAMAWCTQVLMVPVSVPNKKIGRQIREREAKSSLPRSKQMYLTRAQVLSS